MTRPLVSQGRLTIYIQLPPDQAHHLKGIKHIPLPNTTGPLLTILPTTGEENIAEDASYARYWQ